MAWILLGPASLCYAQNIKGAVSSIDSAKNQIVINNIASGKSETVTIHPNILSGVTIGSIVNVTLKEGTTIVDTVEVEIV